MKLTLIYSSTFHSFQLSTRPAVERHATRSLFLTSQRPELFSTVFCSKDFFQVSESFLTFMMYPEKLSL